VTSSPGASYFNGLVSYINAQKYVNGNGECHAKYGTESTKAQAYLKSGAYLRNSEKRGCVETVLI
jgi:hypothetical protein